MQKPIKCSKRGCDRTEGLIINYRVLLADGNMKAYYYCTTHTVLRRSRRQEHKPGELPNPSDEWAWRRASIASRKRILERRT